MLADWIECQGEGLVSVFMLFTPASRYCYVNIPILSVPAYLKEQSARMVDTNINGTGSVILPRRLGSTNLTISAIGLGCSRLGSILGLTVSEADRFVRSARDIGINFFDTADIYGQGDSERVLGRVLPTHGVVISTKIGQRFPPAFRAMNILKRPLAPLLRLSSASSRGLSNQRKRSLPRNFEPTYLLKAVDRSLKRLGRETIDILFLHSPDLQTVMEGEAVHCLDGLRCSGKIKMIGISADTDEVVTAALGDPRVSAIQCRMSDDPALHELLMTASRRQVVIVAREILGGVRKPGYCARSDAIQACFVVGPKADGVSQIWHIKLSLADPRIAFSTGAGCRGS